MENVQYVDDETEEAVVYDNSSLEEEAANSERRKRIPITIGPLLSLKEINALKRPVKTPTDLTSLTL